MEEHFWSKHIWWLERASSRRVIWQTEKWFSRSRSRLKNVNNFAWILQFSQLPYSSSSTAAAMVLSRYIHYLVGGVFKWYENSIFKFRKFGRFSEIQCTEDKFDSLCRKLLLMFPKKNWGVFYCIIRLGLFQFNSLNNPKAAPNPIVYCTLLE